MSLDGRLGSFVVVRKNEEIAQDGPDFRIFPKA